MAALHAIGNDFLIYALVFIGQYHWSHLSSDKNAAALLQAGIVVVYITLYILWYSCLDIWGRGRGCVCVCMCVCVCVLAVVLVGKSW